MTSRALTLVALLTSLLIGQGGNFSISDWLLWIWYR
jgi:hypothetical protein